MKGRPTVDNLQGALIRLALQATEKEDDDFLSEFASSLLLAPNAANDSTPTGYYGFRITSEMRDQLNALVLEFRSILGKTVTQAVLIRAALAEWSRDIDPSSPAVAKAILAEHRRYTTVTMPRAVSYTPPSLWVLSSLSR